MERMKTSVAPPLRASVPLRNSPSLSLSPLVDRMPSSLCVRAQKISHTAALPTETPQCFLFSITKPISSPHSPALPHPDPGRRSVRQGPDLARADAVRLGLGGRIRQATHLLHRHGRRGPDRGQDCGRAVIIIIIPSSPPVHEPGDQDVAGRGAQAKGGQSC